MDLDNRIADAMGLSVRGKQTLGGGQIGSVHAVTLEHGRQVVAKTSEGVPLSVEAFMLRYLGNQTTLPVPDVLFSHDELLVLEMLPGTPGAAPESEVHAADLLADLHGHRAERFGFEKDTMIGPFRQPNGWSTGWSEFFAEHRLRYMAAIAAERGTLPGADLDRIEAIADAAPALLDHDTTRWLVHGDVWSTNVLTEGDRVRGFLDPAIYYADPEVEPAYIGLFGTFGGAFFDRYGSVGGIESGYVDNRRDVYQLYPLLVHVAAFGEGYLSGLRARVARIESRH